MTEMRYVVPETTFIWFVFFWVALGWKHICDTTPDFVYEQSQAQVQNLILKFFLSSFLFICIGAVQFVLHNLSNYQDDKGSTINKFKDLCTLANISLVMMVEHSYGFYLHAKTPWQTADIPLDWLQKELQAETKESAGFAGRGLREDRQSGRYAVQTFQIYIPIQLRSELVRV